MFKKQKMMMEHLDSYLQMAEETLQKFTEAIEYTLENGVDEHYSVLAAEISEKEQNCDEIRRQIELEMFTHSLLPETSNDILVILEMADGIPNHCQNVADMICDQKTEFIEPIRNDIWELLEICLKAFKATVEAIKDCLGKMLKVKDMVYQIDDYRNMSYSLKRKIVRTIYSDKSLSNHPGGQLLQRDAVTHVEEICSLSKKLSERILLTAVKRGN